MGGDLLNALQIGSFFGQIDFLQYAEFMIRILAACVCGAAIGYERSRRSKSAGLRTHIIVCCAAALMMIVSKYGFADLAITGINADGTKGADPGRIAAQVISGISFLGAGIIVKHGSTVKGLTTAAGIWATAGIGLAIGAGMYFIGLFSMVTISIIQFVMHRIRFGNESWVETAVDFNVKKDENFNKEFFDRVARWKAHIDEIEITDDVDNTMHYKALIKISADIQTEEVIFYLSNDERITRFSVIPDIPG